MCKEMKKICMRLFVRKKLFVYQSIRVKCMVGVIYVAKLLSHNLRRLGSSPETDYQYVSPDVNIMFN